MNRSLTDDSYKKNDQRPLPLEGIRVLDLGEALAGPYGATLLADFGAEVIKIEEPKTGNNMRSFPPFYNGTPLLWINEGRGKKSVTVDMRTEKGQELIKRLVKISDVVVENFRPGTLERWNLGYEELKRINPEIILIRVTGFGQKGPYINRPSYDTIGSAIGGITYVTGFPDDPPLRTGLAVCDYLSGSFNTLGILLSLYHKGKIGKGQWVDLAQYEAIFRICGYTAAIYDKLQFIPDRVGNRHPVFAPDGIFDTRDGDWVAISAGDDKHFRRLVIVMGREDLSGDPRFNTIVQRSFHAQEIYQIVNHWTKGLSTQELISTLLEAGIPSSPIYSTKDICEDQHFIARENIVEVEDPNIGKVKIPGVIPKLSLTPGKIRLVAPALGEHTDEVLQNLVGLRKDEIMYLKGEGIIAPKEDKAKADAKARDKVETEVRDPIDLGLKTQYEKPLEGLRVLEIGAGLAGPFCTSILGDFGAEIIKVERPDQGDLLRKLPPLYNGSSLWWKVENRNKKSITLDLKNSEARGIFLKLASLSDLIVECMRPGTMEGFGLGYQELNKINRRIILVRISGFGQYGPYRDRPSYDTVAQAIGGLSFLTGFPDGPPTRVGWDVTAYFAGLYGAIGALIALYYRDVMKTGEGQWIDLGLYEPLVRISYHTVPYYDKLGCVEERMGNQFSSGAPIDFYKTKDDQWAVILAGHDTVFARIMKAIGMEEMASDPRFSNNAKRGENKDLVNGIVAHWVERHTLKEVVDTLTAYEAPVSPIYSIKDIFEDPHFKVRENIISVEDNTFGELKMQGVIPKLSLTPGKVESTGPSLGEHNEEIFKGLLGLKQYHLDRLKMEGVM